MVTLSSNLFSKLPAGLSCLLLKAAQPRYVKSGELLFAAGDAGDGCYLIEQGLLKVVVTSRRGEERIIAILGAGAIVGELSILDGLPRSASVFALGECVLRFVSREAFQRCADEHPEMYQALVVILAARLRQVDDAFAASVFMTVKARVARAFIELVEYIGELLRCCCAPFRCGCSLLRCCCAPFRCGCTMLRCCCAPFRCLCAPSVCFCTPLRCCCTLSPSFCQLRNCWNSASRCSGVRALTAGL